jgi:hypothetical protein
MNNAIDDIELLASPKYIPLEHAANRLSISTRQLRSLLSQYGCNVYRFGHRSRRITVEDFVTIVKRSQETP